MEGIRPAQLSFLCIYNPSFGDTDETTHDQIVYHYSSKSGRVRKTRTTANISSEEQQNEERNERVRQIGLAQGMVNFARDFSDNKSIDYVETDKARILMHEIEPKWWMLASVDLTRIESTSLGSKARSTKDEAASTVEYSTRELAPSGLLLQHFLRAHSIFLLHHGASLTDIYARHGRQNLSSVLERFWSPFIRHWDVLMYGTPATDIYNGMRLAAGGELGMGVGEEEWGSGERDVLEDLVRRTEGLVDIIVSRFGEPPVLNPKCVQEDPELWLGSVRFPMPGNGVIFSGVGAISRDAARKISAWMEWIVTYGLGAYGVSDSPHSARRRRRRKTPLAKGEETNTEQAQGGTNSTESTYGRKGIPPSIIPVVEQHGRKSSKEGARISEPSIFDKETMIRYMTLGLYGSSWGMSSGRPRSPSPKSGRGTARKEGKQANEKPLHQIKPQSLEEKARELAKKQPDVFRGCYLIGLQGNLHDEDISEEDEIAVDAGTDQIPPTIKTWARRIMLRTLYVERATDYSLETKLSMNQTVVSVVDRLRVVVYARQPFIYTFLFDPNEQPGLALPSFYKNLHTVLEPLHKPLVRTTSPADVRRRLYEAAAGHPSTESALSSSIAPVYDLVFDPANLTCHTTLPNIPDTCEGGDGEGLPTWSRMDALAVHGLILRMWQDTRHRGSELERTARTTRGWWVVWMRLPGNDAEEGKEEQKQRQHAGSNTSGQESMQAPSASAASASSRKTQEKAGVFREGFLVRKALGKSAAVSSTVGIARKRIMSGFGGGTKDEDGLGGWGPARLAEGIGFDTRRYIEGLLSLNR